MSQREGTSQSPSDDVPSRHEPEVRDFLDGYARALTAGDGAATAAQWEAPALVVGDEGVMAVTAVDEVAAFFSTAKDQYVARGITDTRPEIVQLRWLTSRIAMVEVRWPYLDDRGKEMGEESSTYTLRRDDNGDLKIRVVVMHGLVTTH